MEKGIPVKNLDIAEEITRDAQKAWAKSHGISFDQDGYVCDVEANLWKPLSTCAREAFEKGAGSELGGHMKALHSSSALAANFFDYWTERDKAPLLSALGMDADGAETLDFEKRFPTGLRGTSPHLDVAIGLSSGCVVAIECKFTEHLVRSTEGRLFSKSYFPSSGDLWTEKGLPKCQALAKELHGNRSWFEFLNPWQLLKHALGLAEQLCDQFSLQYLYYNHHGERSEAHEKEVARFEECVGDEIRFRALTYQEIFDKLSASNQADPEYLGYLRGRYFPIRSAL